MVQRPTVTSVVVVPATGAEEGVMFTTGGVASHGDGGVKTSPVPLGTGVTEGRSGGKKKPVPAVSPRPATNKDIPRAAAEGVAEGGGPAITVGVTC